MRPRSPFASVGALSLPEETRLRRPAGGRATRADLAGLSSPDVAVMVPEVGLEPTLPFENQILNLARLPIPPLWHGGLRGRLRAVYASRGAPSTAQISPWGQRLPSRDFGGPSRICPIMARRKSIPVASKRPIADARCRGFSAGGSWLTPRSEAVSSRSRSV